MKLGNILIVDDEELLVNSIAFLLNEYTENVHIAHNGLEGLEILQNHQIQCVISDISMPKMNGMEFMKAARESGINVPFIFFTAYGQSKLMLQAAQYGAFDFLMKPDFEGLQEAIARGTKEGFKRQLNESSAQSALTEYEKILLEMNKPT
ncbi:MAG: response regulator [Bdellovibrionales bacterium]|nr:response regulator [Bdellovibrionales bacterium]